VREVLVTITEEGGVITVSDLENVNIHSSNEATLPYVQRPQGGLDDAG
jgi:hypothetical protein